MLQIEEAIELLRAQVEEIEETEEVTIDQAIGRVLAEDVSADRDQPPFPRSPLDGYAVRGEDLVGAGPDSPVVLKVIGNIYAGEAFTGTVGAGEAVRLTTGAPIPDGANAVVRQEDTDEGREQVAVKKEVAPWQNYCYQGEDYKAGTVLLKAGRVLTARSLSVVSTLGKATVKVKRQARVAVISTGDEVIPPEEAWRPGKIYDCNRTYISSRLREAGNPPVISLHAADEGAKVAEEIKEAAAQCDLVITTGGVSVGEKDILHEVVDILGAELLFWRVVIKPGSPTLAFMCDGTLVLSLSGNPYGAMVNYELLGGAILNKLTGSDRFLMKKETAIMDDEFAKKGGRRFLRGIVENGKVRLADNDQASGSVASMINCNCFIEITPDMNGAHKGDSVTVYRFA